MAAMKSPIILPSKYAAQSLRATYSNVWSLSPEDRDKLGVYLLIKTNVGELLNKIDTSHNYIDYFTYHWNNSTLTTRVNYINGTYSYLQDLGDSGKKSDICLVSLRMARVMYPNTKPAHPYISDELMQETTSIALVLINPENIRMDGLKCWDINGKEIVNHV